MSEHKRDELLATGVHNAWAGEPAAIRTGKTSSDRKWLDRKPSSNPRHEAITRSLYSWSNYKSWTDKVRNNWDKDDKK